MRGSETTLGWVFPDTSRPSRPSSEQFFRSNTSMHVSLSLSRLPPLILSQLRGAGGFSLSLCLSLCLSLSLSLSPCLSLSLVSLSRSLSHQH